MIESELAERKRKGRTRRRKAGKPQEARRLHHRPAARAGTTTRVTLAPEEGARASRSRPTVRTVKSPGGVKRGTKGFDLSRISNWGTRRNMTDQRAQRHSSNGARSSGRSYPHRMMESSGTKSLTRSSGCGKRLYVKLKKSASERSSI